MSFRQLLYYKLFIFYFFFPLINVFVVWLILQSCAKHFLIYFFFLVITTDRCNSNVLIIFWTRYFRLTSHTALSKDGSISQHDVDDEQDQSVFHRSENFQFSDVSGGCKSGKFVENGLTHLLPIHPFSTPWKHQKALRFSDVFRR